MADDASSTESVSLRLDRETLAILRTLASAKGTTVSDAIREAVQLWLRAQSTRDVWRLRSEVAHARVPEGFQAPMRALEQQESGQLRALRERRDQLRGEVDTIQREGELFSDREAAAREIRNRLAHETEQLERTVMKLRDLRRELEEAESAVMAATATRQMLDQHRSQILAEIEEVELLLGQYRQDERR